MKNRIAAAALALVVGLMMSSGVAYAAKPVPAGKVNINTATVEQLATLPGVGPALAQRIVDHRQKAGSFKSVQELMSIRGIGEKSFQKMEAHLTTGGEKTAAK
jgi:competence protein ComEA